MTIWNAQIGKQLIAAMRAGHTYRDAAAMAGVGEKTFERWRERGREGHKQYTPIFGQFLKDIEAAAADARADMFKTIVDAAKGTVIDPITGESKPVGIRDWRAAAFLLEKRDWQNYDQRAVIGHAQAAAARDANLADLSDHQVLTHLREIVRAKAMKDRLFFEFLCEVVDQVRGHHEPIDDDDADHEDSGTSE